MNTENDKEFIVIGGMNFYGSGLYMNNLTACLSDEIFPKTIFNTNNMRIAGVIKLFRYLKNNTNYEIIFQPSICGYSFLRDLLIIFLIKFYKKKYVLCILSHIYYKNFLFRLSIIRNLFFKNQYVITAAKIKEINEIALSSVIINSFNDSPLKSSKKTKNGNFKIKFCHFGYLDEIKGFDIFSDLAYEHHELSFLAIGKKIHKDKNILRNPNNLEIFEPEEQKIFFEMIQKIIDTENEYQVFLFCSKYDLAPTILFEIAPSLIPICVIENSRAHQIIKNLLPNDCYYVCKCISSVNSELYDDQLVKVASKMYKYSKKNTMLNFSNRINSFITNAFK